MTRNAEKYQQGECARCLVSCYAGSGACVLLYWLSTEEEHVKDISNGNVSGSWYLVKRTRRCTSLHSTHLLLPSLFQNRAGATVSSRISRRPPSRALSEADVTANTRPSKKVPSCLQPAPSLRCGMAACRISLCLSPVFLLLSLFFSLSFACIFLLPHPVYVSVSPLCIFYLSPFSLSLAV